MPKPKTMTIDEYIALAPKATDAIKWGAPVFEKKTDPLGIHITKDNCS